MIASKLPYQIASKMAARDFLKSRIEITKKQFPLSAGDLTDRFMLGQTRKDVSALFAQATHQQARTAWKFWKGK